MNFLQNSLDYNNMSKETANYIQIPFKILKIRKSPCTELKTKTKKDYLF